MAPARHFVGLLAVGGEETIAGDFRSGVTRWIGVCAAVTACLWWAYRSPWSLLVCCMIDLSARLWVRTRGSVPSVKRPRWRFAAFAAMLVIQPLLVGVLIVGLTKGVRVFAIAGDSMVPGIQPGELLVTDGSAEPARGDVIVYEEPFMGRAVVKRTVGLAGDMVDVRRGHAWVNGEPISELYVYRPPPDSLDAIYVPQVRLGPQRVPDGHWFCLGDNRNGSVDSRVYGAVARDRFLGRALYVLWSSDWSRIGSPIN